ncbi:NADPH-dependent oxidoreductase [Natronospirillum operosum]|uniref:NADPH-dependent oxidoreductase n=1 Tax=Natronospirillum operosum TaxID=2759953 RepID=A0A4Z0W4J7_9GAMM|nr:NAD(P)H-dependent oxidoreductase [Natronospirillum operosum]TGG90268.1 NADPH-dependent oxidoreductase [Natronospirillum operosum]
MLEIGVIVGSTRPGRNAQAVAEWVLEGASEVGNATYRMIDIAAFDLPLLDEPLGARAVASMKMEYAQEHTKHWASAIDALDAFVFVTPEYNFGPPASLKNAMDYLYPEWGDKAASFVSYGVSGGARAVAQLRQICAELQLYCVRDSVEFSLSSDFEGFTTFAPKPEAAEGLGTMVHQLERLANALRFMRTDATRAATNGLDSFDQMHT